MVTSITALAQGRTAGELLVQGESAYNSGRWEVAENAFEEFLKNYSGIAGTEQAIAKVKPLLAICLVRRGAFEKALPLLEEAIKLPGGDPKMKSDLLFFSGLSHLRTNHAGTARKQLAAIFADPQNDRGRRMESLILGGMTYVMEKNWKDAADFFQKHTTEIRAFSPEAGARSDILLFYALMQEKRWDEAEKTSQILLANPQEIRQVVTFSSLLIELGAHFLEDGKPHKAISLLGRVSTKAEIEQLQQSRLTEAEEDLELSGRNPVRAAQLQTSIGEMRRELETFAKVPQFDSAARLRLAGAYFQLNRTREACLILDQMVRQMEPDAMVESATASLIRGWMSLERYARAARTAELYLERCGNLPEKPNSPDVMFLRAQALEGLSKYQEASDAYREVATKFKGQPIAMQAEFMAAYNILQLEHYDEAGAQLERQAKALKTTDEMRQHVTFWRAMAYYFDQDWEKCRERFDVYLEDHPQGEYADDSNFRIGYSYFSEARYPEAIKRLKAFANDYPQSEWLAEALLTLGDSLAAEGDLKEADAAYAKIGPEAPGFHDEGWMKRGNLLKVQKDLPGMTKLYQAFLEKRPDSPRIAEALQWLGWVAKQEGRVDEARKIYWNAISRFGNDDARPGLEEIILALQGFYTGPDRGELETRLHDDLEKAKSAGEKRRATRLGWALAQLQLVKKDVAQEVRRKQAGEELVLLAPGIEAKETSPRILADVGDALVEKGEVEQARKIYEGLRKWWPRSPERDRAYAGLGFIEVKADNETAAIARFDQYEKSSVMPKTAPDEKGISLVEGELGGKVALARARILAKRDAQPALDLLLAVQRTKSMPARIRADAFMEAARLHVKRQQFRESLPYFEQIYLLFNRFPELVAGAYYERGEVLEKLNMPDKAREVYSELAQREDLAPFEPAKLGLRRAEALGGVIPIKEPEEGLIPPAPVVR